MGMRCRAGLAGVLLATGIAATGAVLSAAPVAACSCIGTGSGSAANYPSNTRIFTGTVTQIEDPQGGGPLVSSMRPVVVHIAVEKVYSGRVGAEQLVRTVASGASCGFEFEEGQRYTVFAEPPATGDMLSVGMCSGTVHGGIDAAAYGLGSGTSPPGRPASPWRTALAAAGLVALLGGGVALALRVRRGAGTPS